MKSNYFYPLFLKNFLQNNEKVFYYSKQNLNSIPEEFVL